jgi:hypothetical protein
MFYKLSAHVRKYTSAKGYHYTKNTKVSNMLNTLTVTIKHPKLGEDVSTWWRKTHADYFESQITYVGAK